MTTTYVSEGDRLRLMLAEYGNEYHRVSRYIYDNIPEVRTGVTKIARYTTKGIHIDAGGTKRQNKIDNFNNNIGNSLNVNYTLDQFSEMLVKQAVLYGIVIVEKITEKSKVIDARILDRNMVTIEKNSYGKIEKITGMGKDNKSKEIPLDNLIIMPVDTTYSGEVNPSTPVSVVADDVALYIQIMEDFAEIMDRYAYPHIHVSLPETTSDKVADKVQEEVSATEAGSSFVTIGGDMDILDGQKNLADVTDVLHHLQMTIASGLMIPAFMLEFSEGSNRSLGKEQRRDMQRVIFAYRSILSKILINIYSGVVDNPSDLKVLFDDFDVDDDNTQQKNRVLFAQAIQMMQKAGYEVDGGDGIVFTVDGGEGKISLKYNGNKLDNAADGTNLVRTPDVVAAKEKRNIEGDGDNAL